MIRRIASLVFCLAIFAGLASAQVRINGAGATFPFPIYSKWFFEYNKQNPNVQINYQSIGSGGGIRQITAGTVDFGATDGPMTEAQMQAAGRKIHHIPTVMGAVVPAFNVPGVKELKVSGQLLANIYLGRVTNWNDPAIAAENKGVNFPNLPIIVVRRSDGSGTTFVFTDFLSKASPDWNSGPGRGNSVRWPVGIGGKGNEGVAGLVRQMEGSIGYIELIYAISNKIDFASVKNSSGNYVKASLEGTKAAAASVKNMPSDYRVSITNAPGKDAYPIASFTWLLVPDSGTGDNRRELVKFLNWMTSEGQKMAEPLGYAPLPAEVLTKVKATISQLK